MANPNETFLVFLVVGTGLLLPTLLAVPVTQFVMRRAARIVPMARLDAASVMDIDRVGVERLLSGIEGATLMAPAAAEGIVNVEFTPIHTFDADGFVARNDRLVRAAMTVHMLVRLLMWVARPFGAGRLRGFLGAARAIALHTDPDGFVDSVETYAAFIKDCPVEPEPLRVVA